MFVAFLTIDLLVTEDLITFRPWDPSRGEGRFPLSVGFNFLSFLSICALIITQWSTFPATPAHISAQKTAFQLSAFHTFAVPFEGSSSWESSSLCAWRIDTASNAAGGEGKALDIVQTVFQSRMFSSSSVSASSSSVPVSDGTKSSSSLGS